MKKVLIIILISSLSLKAQSKLYPNTGNDFNLEQSIVDNTLSISHPDYVITKLFLYNKSTFKRTTFDNYSNNIAVDLNKMESGMYTVMVYTNGDIVVLKLKVVNDNFKEDIEPTEAIVKTEEIEDTKEIEKRTLKYYRVVASINGTSISKYNVFTESRKNGLIKRNKLDVKSYTGRKNTLIVSALYTDGSEELIYETMPKNRSAIFKRDKGLAKTKDL
ncbi:hypothetical protein [Algibacter pectinivorans]|uniref:Por secretion system C-terminal sorting domain-containing protein n=1 Tax=Algibacter pectinivorans TaxID=870482 RepID=A0A1I1MTF0_9FLAO|nr:hypothetical protein [Algibacter pectinivorans]SFC88631.1 hypothetical protein SAMN04487987_101520 [Algibacter pectinivorans]